MPGNDLVTDCEQRFSELNDRFGDGDLDEQQFEELVSKLRVQDPSGTWWRISSKTGEWMRQEGDRWIEGGRPTGAREPAADHVTKREVEETLPPPPPPPKGVKAGIGVFIRYTVGALLLLWGIGMPLLGLLGAESRGTITGSSRTDTTEDGKSGIFTISYSFKMSNGEVYEGSSTRTGTLWGDTGVSSAESVTIHYVPGLPFLNAPTWTTDISFIHVIIAAVGYILIRPPGRRKDKSRKN